MCIAVIGVPHLMQNFTPPGNSAPHPEHCNPAGAGGAATTGASAAGVPQYMQNFTPSFNSF